MPLKTRKAAKARRKGGIGMKVVKENGHRGNSIESKKGLFWTKNALQQRKKRKIEP
jgi:hypothetical protein